jgi:N-ethylmaleimide reductase
LKTTPSAPEGGLIISEATPVSIRSYGYAGAPGIYSETQIPGWRRVTDAVHAKGGRIFLQLWHVGRQSHTDLQPNGEAPVAPSAIAADGYAYTKQGEAPFSMSRALELHEIPDIIEEFRAGAERALRAGFDGVEIHGANGYLPDQFLQDGTNKRTDAYGGPIENRARFLLKVTEAAASVWGHDRVGVRISPSGTYGSMSDSDPAATFGYVATQLDRLGIAYPSRRRAAHQGHRGCRKGPGTDRGARPPAQVQSHLDRGRRIQSGLGRSHRWRP